MSCGELVDLDIHAPQTFAVVDLCALRHQPSDTWRKVTLRRGATDLKDFDRGARLSFRLTGRHHRITSILEDFGRGVSLRLGLLEGRYRARYVSSPGNVVKAKKDVSCRS